MTYIYVCNLNYYYYCDSFSKTNENGDQQILMMNLLQTICEHTREIKKGEKDGILFN
jgi:hypothetical protein